MTQPPPLPPSPSPLPFGDRSDEALSALLDGELGAFAADHGLTEADARDRLEQWSEYPARLAALEQGRAAVGEPVPPLDDLTQRRLVRNALPAADGVGATSNRKGWSWLRISAAAAAALIVLAGLGAMLTTLGTGDDTAKSSGAGSVAAPEAARGDLGNVGDVSDPAAIKALLDPATEEQKRLSRDSAAGGGSTEDSNQSFAPPLASGSLDGGDAKPVDPQACAAQAAASRPIRFFATGTYQGQPVTIAGVDFKGRTIAYVVPSNDCTRVLTSISR